MGLIVVLCVLFGISAAGAAFVPMDTASIASPGSGAMPASVSSVNDNPISIDQAKDSIRLFVEDPGFDPILAQTVSLPIGNYYIFYTKDSSFYVNQKSGIVEFAFFNNNQADSNVINFNRDQAYARATEVAQKKYDGYATTSWKLVTDKLGTVTNYRWNETSQQPEGYTGKEYLFTFREERDHVLTPNLIHIRINPATGMVSEWNGYHRSITVSLTPALSLSDAMKIAENYYSGSVNIDHTEGYLAVVIIQDQSAESLAYVITVRGTSQGDNQYEDSETAIVDARTGKMIGWSRSDAWPESGIR